MHTVDKICLVQPVFFWNGNMKGWLSLEWISHVLSHKWNHWQPLRCKLTFSFEMWIWIGFPFLMSDVITSVSTFEIFFLKWEYESVFPFVLHQSHTQRCKIYFWYAPTSLDLKLIWYDIHYILHSCVVQKFDKSYMHHMGRDAKCKLLCTEQIVKQTFILH